MGQIRGVVNPMPTKGKAPTGIFSTRGSQKQDGVTAPSAAVATKNAAHAMGGKVAPAKRNNMLKGG